MVLHYQIVGSGLCVSPLVVSVPKGVARPVLVEVVGGGPTNGAMATMAEGAYVETTLHGASFDARRIMVLLNGPMLLPPLNLVGDYRLDDIRLADAVHLMRGGRDSLKSHVAALLSLAPGFSRVGNEVSSGNGFNRFPSLETGKPLKRLQPSQSPNTGLKPGANERWQPTETHTRVPELRRIHDSEGWS